MKPHPVAHQPEMPAFEEPALPETESLLWKTPLWSYIRHARIAVILSVPLIFACAIPFFFLDLVVYLYHSICFPLYGIPKVPRHNYLIFDRGRLTYLNALEKLGCVYCSYANGLLAWVAEIAARTEQHFCPIQHGRTVLNPHARYHHFVPYGNAHAYRTRSGAIARAFDDVTPQR